MISAKQAETQLYIARKILQIVPDEWEEIHVQYMEAGRTSQSRAFIVLGDETTQDMRNVSWNIDDAFAELRKSMYDPAYGTWYTALLIVKKDLKVSTQFTYDEEPQWFAPVSLISYREDIQMYPRPLSAQPLWLQSHIIKVEDS